MQTNLRFIALSFLAIVACVLLYRLGMNRGYVNGYTDGSVQAVYRLKTAESQRFGRKATSSELDAAWQQASDLGNAAVAKWESASWLQQAITPLRRSWTPGMPRPKE
jgi:hypothetical protein